MKVAVVTGGTRGIGLAICQALQHAGYRVFALGRSASSVMQDPAIVRIACDVADDASVKQAFETIREQVQRIDVLVNNAGLAGADRLDDPDDDTWHRVIEVNLGGTFRCTRAALPWLQDAGGRVVCISSFLGLRGVPDQVAYTAAKHGVVGLVKAFALALAPRGITVNAICPGWVDTDMARQRFTELGIDAQQARSGVPTGLIVTLQEVADMVLYLCSPAARNVTGQALALDGGSSV
jgi:NAD(P)-dependent dehydrogenase (short-subunit alcohol dehydrogenase family)